WHASLYTLFPYTTLFRSHFRFVNETSEGEGMAASRQVLEIKGFPRDGRGCAHREAKQGVCRDGGVTKTAGVLGRVGCDPHRGSGDRKSTRLNSSHVSISY